MSRRIDIELTSQTGDGSWTWRAAGARQPKGTVDASLVPPGETVGTVLQATVETGLEGIEILSLTQTKPARSPEKVEGRIEVKGTPRRAPDVSVILAPGSGKRRRDDDGERRGGGRRGDAGDDGGRARALEERERRRAARGRGSGSGGGAGNGSGSGTRRPGGRRPGDGEGRPGRGERPAMPTSTTYRNAMLATLRPEQIPVAEQLLRGGIQAVRQAINDQNTAAKASGKPPVAGDALVAMAEELLPVVRLADWKDRASVAQTAGKEYRLRELRAVVTASRTVTLDEEGRATAKALQESLDQRTAALREEWLARMTNAINDGRVHQAVEASIRPPEPGTRLPADLAVRLAAAAGEAMSADKAPEEWMQPARRRGGLSGPPDGQAGRDPRRRGGPSGGPQRRRFGAGPGQAARPEDPASPAASGQHRAPLQSNRRLSVSSRAVNPAASRRCLV